MARSISGVFKISVLGIIAATVDISANADNRATLPENFNPKITPSETSLSPYIAPQFYRAAADSRTPEIIISPSRELYRLLHSVDNNKTGFTASAYQKVGENHIVLVFNGISKPWYSHTNTPLENPWQAWNDFLTGFESRVGIVNRQMNDLYQFISDVSEIAPNGAQYESIGYSLGGVHGLHAKAVWGIPFTGMSPVGLPNHRDLYTPEELDRINLGSSFSVSTRTDFVTGLVGDVGPIEYYDTHEIIADHADLIIDSIGRHTLPAGYESIFQFR